MDGVQGLGFWLSVLGVRVQGSGVTRIRGIGLRA